MTNEMLAQYANYALASAALVITVAMLCYALYLAQAVPMRERVETSERVPATVGGGSADAPAADEHEDEGEESSVPQPV